MSDIVGEPQEIIQQNVVVKPTQPLGNKTSPQMLGELEKLQSKRKLKCIQNYFSDEVQEF